MGTILYHACTLSLIVTHAIAIFSIDINIRVDLNNLLIQLRQQVSPKWYQFGDAIGVKKEILNRIAEYCFPQECIVEMLDHWLRDHTGKPTWREVAKALNVINLPNLAVDIERVYTTGTWLQSSLRYTILL